MAKSTILLLVLATAALQASGQPPPGPHDQAICPVSGKRLNITAATAAVLFTNGQKLYFSEAKHAHAYVKEPRKYWLAPTDLPLPGFDGRRGLPDLRNSTLTCPESGESFVVSMATPRVIHKFGQNVYFCCFGCVVGFWTDPAAIINGTVVVV